MVVRKGLLFKFMKYSVVGFISTVIYFLSIFVLIEVFEKDPILASSISFVIMTIFSFILNKKYTFGGHYTNKKFIRFIFVSTVGFILNYAIMFTILHVFSFHYLVGELVTILVIPLINFTLNNYWTFKSEGTA
ncbi:GtrA family protein [Bacillus sp. V5-8f]|uniref:GtrA family protein n=1 Tax=Bacillus sp. V5-8f TaxID=2053044 RepID=UPI000C7675E0|nr:GtrA family protein [Bacillus sp. V5-8f]